MSDREDILLELKNLSDLRARLTILLVERGPLGIPTSQEIEHDLALTRRDIIITYPPHDYWSGGIETGSRARTFTDVIG